LIKIKSKNLIKVCLNDSCISTEDLIYFKTIYHRIPLNILLHLNNNKTNNVYWLNKINIDIYNLIYSVYEIIMKENFMIYDDQTYIKNYVEILVTNQLVDNKKLYEMRLMIINKFDKSYTKLKNKCLMAIDIINSIKDKTKLLNKIKNMLLIMIEIMNPNIEYYPDPTYIIKKLKI
jgi:hypothetical protein